MSEFSLIEDINYFPRDKRVIRWMILHLYVWGSYFYVKFMWSITWLKDLIENVIMMNAESIITTVVRI